MKEAYLATDKNFDLECYYSYNKKWGLVTPVTLTRKNESSLSRIFEIDNGIRKVNFEFTVRVDGGQSLYEGRFDGGVTIAGKLKARDFYLPVLSDRGFQDEFETNKIRCSANFAYALPLVLEDGDYHISVHPHAIYDWQNKLKEPIERYLADSSYSSVILLEAGNLRGNQVNIFNFFAGKESNLVMPNFPSSLVNVPQWIPLIVSPAGNSRYEILAEKEINVIYTGGNHNYCIWNSARHILENLLNSRSSAVVNFRYDMAAIVAQPRGVERTGINFPKTAVNKSNLLRDILVHPSVDEATYHKNYLYYFADWLADEYVGMYRTYTVDYEADGFKKTVTFQGKGTRDLKVTFRYF